MTFDDLLQIVDELAELPEPEAATLRARGAIRRIDIRGNLIVLDLDPAADLSGLARDLARLGPASDMDVVSPPIRDPARPGTGTDWTRRHSLGYDRGGRMVWFGLVERDGVTRLETVSVHF